MFGLEDKNRIAIDLAKHFIIYSSKAELDQFQRGLETLNVLTFMRKHAAYVKLLFAANTSVLTAQAMLALFEVNWSLPGCPQREREEAVLVAWSEYVMNIEGA